MADEKVTRPRRRPQDRKRKGDVAAPPEPGSPVEASYRHDVIVKFEVSSHSSVEYVAPWIGLVAPSPGGEEGVYVRPAALSFDEPGGYRRTYVLQPHIVEWLREAISPGRLTAVEIAGILHDSMGGLDPYVVYDVARKFAETLGGRIPGFDPAAFLDLVGENPWGEPEPEAEPAE